MARRKRRSRSLLTAIDAGMATAAHAFVSGWTRVELLYKRPLSRLVGRLKFAFYPLLALLAIGWLGYDWMGPRSLDAAENAVFDTVIRWRPAEPPVSKRVAIVEIDDCSIEHFQRKGEGGWPWSRARHADLLDALDRAGTKAVGYDVMFADPSPSDPDGDMILEVMAEGGAGRFVFGASRVHSDFDASTGAIPASQAPGAFAVDADAQAPGPHIALLLPYGKAMREHAGLLDVTRSVDGVLRDMPLFVRAGDWAIPSLPLRLAAYDLQRPASSFPASVRINWRSHSRLPYISAADLIEGKAVCGDPKDPRPDLRGGIALVGYTASGLNDTKPTPVNLQMPGVEVHAEATAALVDGSGIWMPPASLKYFLAAVLVLLTAFAFYRPGSGQ